VKGHRLVKLTFNRNWAILGVAGVVGLVAAFSVQRYIQQRVDAVRPAPADTPTVGVVVAADTLTPGTPVTSRNVAVRQVPREWAHSNAIFPHQFAGAESRKLLTNASKGEPILWAQVEGIRSASFSSTLQTGRRAVTVPVDEVSSISGMLEPGDAIDLVVSLRHGGKVKLLPVMQDVKVLATGTQVQGTAGSQGGHGKQGDTYTTVTLDATPEDARRIMAAREIGKVTALLRAPGDTVRTDMRIEVAHALLGIAKPGGGGRAPVQVLYGGRSRQQPIRPLPEPRQEERSNAVTLGGAPHTEEPEMPQ
jgi:pilus assembly protein CpaB